MRDANAGSGSVEAMESSIVCDDLVASGVLPDVCSGDTRTLMPKRIRQL